MRISYLADHPEFVDTLALWMYTYWRSIVSHETIESRIEKLKSHLNYDALPVAYVAHSGRQVCGTASLRLHDLPGRENLSPWLGGVFVAPGFQHCGIGTDLCTAVETKAKTMFGTQPLYLFTLDKQNWYSRLGWSCHSPCVWQGRDGIVMVKTPV